MSDVQEERRRGSERRRGGDGGGNEALLRAVAGVAERRAIDSHALPFCLSRAPAVINISAVIQLSRIKHASHRFIRSDARGRFHDRKPRRTTHVPRVLAAPGVYLTCTWTQNDDAASHRVQFVTFHLHWTRGVPGASGKPTRVYFERLTDARTGTATRRLVNAPRNKPPFHTGVAEII